MARSRCAALFVAACSLAAAQRASGQEPALVTDRPGFGESASVVGPGRLQLEAGGDWSYVDADNHALDGPELLVRVGLVRSLELRVVAPDAVRGALEGETTSGWTDMSLGVKGHLAAWGNDFAIRGTLYLPTGSPAFTSERVDPELALAWGRTLSRRWSLGATINQRWQRQDSQAATSPSFAVNLSLGARAAAYLEYGADLSRSAPTRHKIDHGYSWSVGARTALDAELGVFLSSADPQLFVGAGISHRF